MTVKVSGGKTSLTSVSGGGAAHAPTRALGLFDSCSSTSDNEDVALVPRQKHPRKSPPPKAAPKPLGASATKGISTQSFHFSFVLELLG
jgi:hypothetical protein